MSEKVFSDKTITEFFAKQTFAPSQFFDMARDVLGGKKECAKNVNDILFAVAEIPPGCKDAKVIKRAFGRNKQAIFELIEDIVLENITDRLSGDEFFNQYVNESSLSLEDDEILKLNTDAIIVASEGAASNYDVVLQDLPANKPIPIPKREYSVGIGTNFHRFFTGHIDFSTLIDELSKAVAAKEREVVFDMFISAANGIPAPATFAPTLPLDDSSDRTDVQKWITAVEAANQGNAVIIIGNKVALSYLNNLMPVSWIGESAQTDYYNSGRMGRFGNNTLLEIPQRFKNNDYHSGELTIPDNKLWAIPAGAKFIYKRNYGDGEFIEDSEGKNNANIAYYKYIWHMGVVCAFGKVLGELTIAV